MSKFEDILLKYHKLNETSEKGGAVFFGADWLSEIPIAELAQGSEESTAVYNRSISGLSIKDAEKAVEECICRLNPCKVFISIGENDITSPDFSASEFAEKYEWLLYSINSKCNCSLYIMSLSNDKSGAVNEMLKKLSEKHGCGYIDVNDCKMSFPKFFSKIRFFLRNRPITFYEAMNI